VSDQVDTVMAADAFSEVQRNAEILNQELCSHPHGHKFPCCIKAALPERNGDQGFDVEIIDLSEAQVRWLVAAVKILEQG
jgi:hypothetical protein